MDCRARCSDMFRKQLPGTLTFEHDLLERPQRSLGHGLLYRSPVEYPHIVEVRGCELADGTFGVQRAQIFDVVDDEGNGNSPQKGRCELVDDDRDPRERLIGGNAHLAESEP